MDNITETEWDHFCNSYIDQQTHTAHSHQARTGTPSYKYEPKLKVSLKEFPKITVNTV